MNGTVRTLILLSGLTFCCVLGCGPTRQERAAMERLRTLPTSGDSFLVDDEDVIISVLRDLQSVSDAAVESDDVYRIGMFVAHAAEYARCREYMQKTLMDNKSMTIGTLCALVLVGQGSDEAQDYLEIAAEDGAQRVRRILREAGMPTKPQERAGEAERIIRELQASSTAEEKVQHINELGRLGAPSSIPALVSELRHSDRDVWKAAEYAISAVGPEHTPISLIDTLIEILESKTMNESVRYTALLCLREHGERAAKAIPGGVSLLESEQSRTGAFCVADDLLRFGPEGEAAVRKCLDSPKPIVREAARRALASVPRAPAK